MSKELVVSATRHETRVAVLEDDQLVEIFYQREKEYSLAGSIHKGRVTRVLPGMQSAFVDIGLERDAFLYVSDFFEDNDEYDKIVTGVEEKVARLDKGLDKGLASIAEALPVLSMAEAVMEAGTLEVPSSAPASMFPRSERPERSGDRPRDDRQRGGRGRRRGRRGPERTGGQRETSGGLPESKYFSPREGFSEAPSESSEAASTSSESATDEIVVLPGETLAKYFADPVAAPAQEAVSEDLEELDPSSGFESSVQESEATEEEFVSEPESKEEEIVLQIVAEQEADSETDEPVVVFLSEETVSLIIEEQDQDTEEDSSEDEILDQESAGEEGPEPARIPTSLTATLREQSPQYQHRVSRRMRRKSRGGSSEDRPARSEEQQSAQNNGNVQEVAGPETRRPREERAPREQREPRDREREERPRPPLPSITDLLREGQEIIVQIAKEPIGQKGARITSHVALPGRFLVYMPSVDHIGVSRKIPSDEERARLKRVLQTHRTGIPGGFIVRTAGDGRTEEELRADMMFLYNLWLDMRQKAEKRPAPQLMHHDLDVVQRILRDQLTSAFKTVWVDNETLYESILSFVQRFQPGLVSRVKLYTRDTPIFDEFGISGELEKALRPKVWLKSGGYIVINQTEALVAIDINTGKYIGKSNRLEDTIVKTNTDSIKEIVRQIRLRDLGGIIVIDFIDMDDRKNRQKVMQVLEEAMRVDRAPYKILQFNDFGLVAITRKRVKQSLERTLCTPCTYCEGAGSIKSVQTVISEILIEATKMAKVLDENVTLRVHPEVARVLKSNGNDYLQEIEETVGKSVLVKSDPLLHQTKFDLV